ncbi:MAG: hypothetical protein JSR37_03615 [Verrucomicrobia bacterium]|nr:hypothetical protein [Verrucomicrobiota bacterium]MBS0638014.1 hypothetical protein [Verrucomicrobiota bacterium]
MKILSIYLAGSIQKGSKTDNGLFWTNAQIDALREHLKGFSVSFLNPAFRTDNLSDQRSVFGRDMTQVFSADVILVDARARRGLGVGAEMMWAKANKIPVITWAPLDSHYRKSETTILDVPVKDFIHPFIESLSDQIVSSLEDASLAIKKVLSDPTFTPKSLEYVASCMEYYMAKGFPDDLPMQEIVSSNESLRTKVESFLEAVGS